MERLLVKSGVTGIEIHKMLPPRNELREANSASAFVKAYGMRVVRPKEFARNRGLDVPCPAITISFPTARRERGERHLLFQKISKG
jgi:hypothetical protein